MTQRPREARAAGDRNLMTWGNIEYKQVLITSPMASGVPCSMWSLRAASCEPRVHSTDADITQFPELGGFELLCIRPAWTAANKFDALHRRAASGDHKGVRGRGRSRT